MGQLSAPLIEKELDSAGYAMLGNGGKIEKLIINIINSKNMRYLKAIPFLIYKHDPDLISLSKKNKNKDLFNELLNITKKLFFDFNINKELPLISKVNTPIKLLNYQEFKEEFELQMKNQTSSDLLIDKQKFHSERNLHFWLSQIFTNKEKQILQRILGDKPISRTDYEYYSRKTKKKIRSIINLQDFSKSLLEKAPKLDPDLFTLKSDLENWINKQEKTKIIVLNYFTKEGLISISFRKIKNLNGKNSLSYEKQTFNIVKKLKEISDERITYLLNKYPKHDFS
ncbi:hypothetical protein HOK51_08655 [Candidatus Woesearchaeota archaeon]|jgi:hypothetical protein|nr:hypothetical protein [Candidatus Woesearchaeota archaeon]MBT6519897.1 hypothetical protein [Candidatus Woesearchaeota archaeon]